MSYRLLLADGRWLIRCGLRATLHHVADYEVVGEAANTSEAIATTFKLVPDIALIDLQLPEDGGLAALARIKAQRSDQKVILLDGDGSVSLLRDALRTGCDGFVRKDGTERDLLEAIRCVRGGGVYLDADVSRRLVLAEARRETRTSSGPLRLLTDRELAVFQLIGVGCTNREAALRLQLSPKTVEKHRAAVMHKLKLRTALDLRLLSLELGVSSAQIASPHARDTNPVGL